MAEQSGVSMRFVRASLNFLVALTVTVTMSGCAFTLATAKPDIYIQNEKKLRRVLAEVLEIPDSKIERQYTLNQLGMVVGKNDEQLKKALEKEFQMEIPLVVLQRNPRVELVVRYFSDEQNIEIVPTEKFEDFGPVTPNPATPSSSKKN